MNWASLIDVLLMMVEDLHAFGDAVFAFLFYEIPSNPWSPEPIPVFAALFAGGILFVLIAKVVRLFI